MERRYWLHRISHKMEVSYPLIESKDDGGLLTIGFSDFLRDKHFLENMVGDAENKWELFERANKDVWGETLYRTRYNLWRFLCEFKEGDYVIVPSWGTFSVYEIAGKPIAAGEAVLEEIKDWNGRSICAGGEDNRYLMYEDGSIIDIGFVIPVNTVEKNIPRTDYAENKLLSRMKIRQTNADIGDLSQEILSAIERYRNNNPISIYAETIKSLSKPLEDIISRIVDPSQFERLIKCYFEKIGADSVYIPSKRDGEGGADGDIVAIFNALKLAIYVQAKHYKGTTGSNAVMQVSEYLDQKGQEMTDLDYSSIAWVISTSEYFSEEAQIEAAERNIRLINGSEFRKMLIDAGLSQIATEFAN